MPEKFLINLVPFLATSCEGGGRPKLNTARIMELIIAIAAMYYAMSIQMVEIKTELHNMKSQITLMESRQYEHYTSERRK